MPPTNTKEEGLEDTIVNDLKTKNGYEEGTNDDYNKEFALDEKRLFEFLQRTQPDKMEKLGVFKDAKKERKFLERLDSQLAKLGIIAVLREGITVSPVGKVALYNATPSENNKKARDDFEKNIFSVTRQLRYSTNNGKLALDLCLFINGLPVITIELKNTLTGQTTKNAVEQYRGDRDPRDTLFSFKRCMAHFAVDDETIEFCTNLASNDRFLPFNKGDKDGSLGNPPNGGIKTDYFWKDILTIQKLARIVENYAQVTKEKDDDGKGKEKQIFPRYHQLDVVEKLLADVRGNGVGKRYLIQHSAGSGKSNSIAWLAYQLLNLEKDGRSVVDSVLVVNDRVILDEQINNTVKQFRQVNSTVAHAKNSGDLRTLIQEGKAIIITTVEKFPFIAGDMRDMKDRRFAVIIDEAHSGQSGQNASGMNTIISGNTATNGMDTEDKIYAMAKGKKLPPNASYFAFTATPKNKTEELFGEPYEENGTTKYRPFHVYSMKQAIGEGFIMDVLENYTTIDSYYRIIQTVENNESKFDKKRAKKKLRAFVEADPRTIAKKATIIVDHFLGQVIGNRKINGQARAMVVTEDIARCVEYYRAIKKCLEERNSEYKAIVAFSGKHDGATSESINKSFRDVDIPKVFREDPYRILVVADMFQTGFDEPLLHTMYVDKKLYDVGAVQTLSRLNRCHPDKEDTFVLDFANNAKDIEDAFSKYYRTTILSGETDPNKLYDLIATLEKHEVYNNEDVERFAGLFVNGDSRDKRVENKNLQALQGILNKCADIYKKLNEDDQVEFKGSAKAFVRTYNFLSVILPYENTEWEKLFIFLNLLILKLPSPREDDLVKGILSMVSLESYRNEIRGKISIKPYDEDAEISPIEVGGTGYVSEPELDLLSQIISDFNDRFGDIQWSDKDSVEQQIRELPAKVEENRRYQNARQNSDEQEARMESDLALEQAVEDTDNMELYRAFCDNPKFREWLSGVVFNITYMKKGRDGTEGSKTA